MEDKTMSIRVDNEFFKTVKMRCIAQDKTLKDYIVGLIEQDLKGTQENQSRPHKPFEEMLDK